MILLEQLKARKNRLEQLLSSTYFSLGIYLIHVLCKYDIIYSLVIISDGIAPSTPERETLTSTQGTTINSNRACNPRPNLDFGILRVHFTPLHLQPRQVVKVGKMTF